MNTLYPSVFTTLLQFWHLLFTRAAKRAFSAGFIIPTSCPFSQVKAVYSIFSRTAVALAIWMHYSKERVLPSAVLSSSRSPISNQTFIGPRCICPACFVLFLFNSSASHRMLSLTQTWPPTSYRNSSSAYIAYRSQSQTSHIFVLLLHVSSRWRSNSSRQHDGKTLQSLKAQRVIVSS